MKEYTVQRVLGGDVGVEDAIWKGIPALSVNCFPWPAFEKKITTTAKLASTASGLLVHFETDEWPLLAQKTENNSQVCEDSCLEFFFRTEDTLKYINLEINPLGTIHADFDREPIPVYARQLRLVSCITPEKWILQYEVPFSLIEKYFGSVGSCLHANFYKCGDKTVHPHYACWNPVGGEKPNFHQPESFGKLIFASGKRC